MTSRAGRSCLAQFGPIVAGIYTFKLVDQANEMETLKCLAKLALEVKQLLDESGIDDDLETELLEFAQLKRDGNDIDTGQYRSGTQVLLEKVSKQLA